MKSTARVAVFHHSGSVVEFLTDFASRFREVSYILFGDAHAAWTMNSGIFPLDHSPTECIVG